MRAYKQVKLGVPCHLRVYLGASSQVDWECHQMQLVVYLRAYLGVCLTVSSKLLLECTVKPAGSVPFSTINSILESMLGCEHENILRGILGT